jgi:hypothetical protein
MKEPLCFKTEYSSHQFIATAFFKDQGLVVDITGPDDHLGGVGIGVPYLRKNGEESANYHCISFPFHRDGELAGNIARNIAKITRYNTVVTLGIHFQNLTKQQLKGIILFLEEWALDLGYQIVTVISSNSDKPV